MSRTRWGRAESIFLYGMAALVFAGIPSIFKKWFPTLPLVGVILGLMVAAFYAIQGRQRGALWADDAQPIPVLNLRQRRQIRIVLSLTLGGIELALAVGRNETATDFCMRIAAAIAFFIAAMHYLRASTDR